MDVILTEDVDKLGRAGEIVSVKPGYGRNYLIPRGLAMLATRGNKAELDHRRKAIEAEQKKRAERYAEMATRLSNVTVSIARKAGEGERLFGSVGSKDIAEALSAQNVDIDRKLIRLPEPIKTVGMHDVEVRFSADVTATLKVNVVGV
jgi:large subunit ribosomal protein L9